MKKCISHYFWTDIVLPKCMLRQLEEICNYVRYRQTVYSDWGFDRKCAGLAILAKIPLVCPAGMKVKFQRRMLMGG